MNIQAPFGIVTGCHEGDRFMVGAALASIRHYCPEVPICLIADGHVDVSDLESEYDLIVLRVDKLPSEEMQKLISGSYRAKLAAMWEGPFEHYVWMDSDAIVWGDFTDQVREDVDFQILWSEISIEKDAEDIPGWLAHYYFDFPRLKKFDSDFEWRGHPYFCAGVYACRKNAISYDEWLELERWQKSEPGLFQFGDMGMLNYSVHSKAQSNELRTTMTDLQHIWAHHGKDELEEDCKASGWKFPQDIARPRIAHFCGRKPNIFDFQAYSKPFTIARLQHHRRRHSLFVAWCIIIREDGLIAIKKLIGKIRRKLGLD